MDRIKDLILERIQHTHQLKNKSDQIFDYQDIYQAKKAEKLRQIKENELIEALFNFGQASKCERQLFEVHSSDVMNSLNYQFNFKPKNRGLFSDIAEMYILFFDSIQLQTRVEEIRIIAKYNLYQNFPFLCMLFKWLIEISRKVFMDIMAVAKTSAANCQKKRPNNQQIGKNRSYLNSSQEQLRSAKLDQKNQNNLTATTASQNTQDSFNNETENKVNLSQIKLNPLNQELEINKKKQNDDPIFMKKRMKNGQKEVALFHSDRINKENSCEGSELANSNNLNHTTSGLNIIPSRDNQIQQEKITSTLPFQSDYSPKLQAYQKQSSLISNNQRRSLRVSNNYTHKHSIDDTDIQVQQDRDISHLMSATQNINGFNLSDLEDDDEDNIEDEDDSQIVIIRQTQSQIFKNGDKGNPNIIQQPNEQEHSSSSNLMQTTYNKGYQQKDQGNSGQKQKATNDFLKHLGKPNIEKQKRRKRDMFFSSIKECLYDVEFVVPKCNDYLINFYIKLMFQRNISVKTTIDAYKVKYWQKFNNTFAKLDPGLIYTEQDKVNADEQLRASLNESVLQNNQFGSLDQLQKSSSQFMSTKNDQSQTNQIGMNQLNQQGKRTCSTLSPINRPTGSDKKQQKIVIETSKSNNFSNNLIQNSQNNQNSNEKDKKRFRTYSYVGNNTSGQVQQQLQLYQQTQQQDKSLSPLSSNLPFNQQFSKEFSQQNSVQLQTQLLPQFQQRNSPEIRRQNIKNSKYNNCIIPAVKNFDTSDIEPNSFNANHIFNTKHSNILKGKQSKFQKNLMMMKIEKTLNSQNLTQFNSDCNMKKCDDAKNTNFIQSNQNFHQNSNILKKINTNDLSLSNIIMATGKKSQQYPNNNNIPNNSALEINMNSLQQNYNSAGGSSCIILQQMNKTTSNIQETLSKSATKNSSFPLNQQNVIQEEELSKSPHQYHLNRMKYRPPKNPKILLQKISNNSEDQISMTNNFNNLTNLLNNQQKNLNQGLQITQYNSNTQSFGMHGPIITSFQNDLIDMQTKQLLKKPQQQNLQIESFNSGIGGVTALKNRKILTQPEDNIAASSNEKLNLSLSTNNHFKSRSASGKGGKEEILQKMQANKLNSQNKQNLLSNLYQTNGILNQEILKQIGAYSIQNSSSNNNNIYSSGNQLYKSSNQSNDNSIFPMLKDLISQQQDNIQKYF